MAEWNTKSRRKKTGGLRRSILASDKKLSQKGGFAANTAISKEDKPKISVHNTLGGSVKRKVKEISYANVNFPKEKKSVKGKLVTVLENKANREFKRRNIITKGALVKVSVEGREITAKVTSRPGQDGTVNAVAVE